MAGKNTLTLFSVSVIITLCSGASFYVIEKGDNSRIKRAATTTINPTLTDVQHIAGHQDGFDILTKDSKAKELGIAGSNITGVHNGSVTLKKETDQGHAVTGTDSVVVNNGKEILAKDSNQSPNTDVTTKAQNVPEPTQQPSDHKPIYDTVSDYSRHRDNQGNQYHYHSSMYDFYNKHRETTTSESGHETTTSESEHMTTTPESEHETTTSESEHETTTPDPDVRHFDSGTGWHNPLYMSRPGELPPMALPMTAEGGDTPVALPLTANSEHQKGQQDSHGFEPSQRNFRSEHGQSETANTHNPENQLFMSHGLLHASGKTNVMPQALPLTSHHESQENSAPVALAQKRIAQGRNVRQKARGAVAGAGMRKKTAGVKEFSAPGRKQVGNQRPVASPGGVNTRAPPKWGSARTPGGAPATPDSSRWGVQATPTTSVAGEAGATGAGGNDFMNNLMKMNMMRGGGGLGGDMFSEMMELQRRMMQTNPEMMQQQMDMYQQMYSQMYPQMFGGAQGTGGEGGGEAGEAGTGMPQSPMMPMPMYGMGEDSGNAMAMAMANGMNLGFQNPLMQQCKTNPDTPLCKMMAQQANMTGMMAGLPMGLPMGMGMGMGMGEVQIEGPMGEMDIEPGELDIEGPIAHQLLLSLFSKKTASQNVHPMHNEITLNHHVLKALQDRFGVNTTQGIQRMATNPEFQAFMFQVLRQSQQSVPGEYHANLSKAQVNQILAGLNSSTSGNDRLPPGNLDQAQLLERLSTKGSHPTSHQAVLTLDRKPAFGQQATAMAQPGNFQALVQQVMGVTTLAPAAEVTVKTKTGTEKPKTSTNETVVPTKKTVGVETAAKKTVGAETAAKKTVGAETAAVLLGLEAPASATGLSGPSGQAMPELGQQNQLLGILAGNTGMGQSVTGQNQLPGMIGGNLAGKKKGDNEIRNKDEIPGLSQDARNRAFGKFDKNNFGNSAGGTVINNGVTVDNRPIGLQEAGLFPGANETIPVEKIQPRYSSSTAFAIAAIVLIAILIIIGPIFCALCKMREKRVEQQRKMKALKNREVSENNIMEAMMLHEFGSSGANSVSNEAAMSPNYYTNEQTRYDTVDPEIECLNQSQPLP